MAIAKQGLSVGAVTSHEKEPKMNELMELFQTADVVLVVLGLNAFGFILKRIPIVPSTYIPAILCVSGVLGYQGIIGWGVKEALIGMVSAAAAIGGHRLVKDWLERPTANNETTTTNSNQPGSVSQ